jgi:nitroreductase
MRQKLGFAIKFAMLAPSESEWQPWKLTVAERHADLLISVKPEEVLADPDRRHALFACGSALVCLESAMRHFGCFGGLELFPDFSETEHVARIHGGTGGGRGAREGMFFETLNPEAHETIRLGGPPVSRPGIELLGLVGAGERAWLEIAHSSTSRQRLLECATLGERQKMPVRVEARLNPESGSPGVSFRSAGNRQLALHVTAREAGPDAGEDGPEEDADLGVWGVIKTKTDDKRGWLAAGQVMARILLQARALGWSWMFFNQALRSRYAREELRTGLGHKGFAQMILCFGRGGEELHNRLASLRMEVSA